MTITTTINTPKITMKLRVSGSEGGGMINGVDVGLMRCVAVGETVGEAVTVGDGEGIGVDVGCGVAVGVTMTGVASRLGVLLTSATTEVNSSPGANTSKIPLAITNPLFSPLAS